MITDKIENIDKYPQIPSYAVEFIKNITKDTNTGKYSLNEKEYVNVEEYTTKLLQDGKFETHNKYIDIQILIQGKERIYIEPKDNLLKPLGYNSEKDIEFYGDNISNSDFVTLDGTNFVLIYPSEAHAPQISINNNGEKVKKAVVKLLF